MPLRHHSPMTSKTLSQHIAHTINRLTELQDEKALDELQEAFGLAQDACYWGTKRSVRLNDPGTDTLKRQANSLSGMKAIFRRVE